MQGVLRGAAAGLAAVCLSTAVAGADDLAGIAARTEQAVAEGRTVEALELADRYAEAVWAAAPLAVRKAVLVEREPTAFGGEVARPDNVYGVDEEIHIYVEPVAFGWTQAGDAWETDLVADVRIATPEGRIIAAHKSFAEFRIASPAPTRDVFLAVTYVFGGLGPGDYVATTTIHDRTGGDAAAFQTPIAIR